VTGHEGFEEYLTVPVRPRKQPFPVERRRASLSTAWNANDNEEFPNLGIYV